MTRTKEGYALLISVLIPIAAFVVVAVKFNDPWLASAIGCIFAIVSRLILLFVAGH